MAIKVTLGATENTQQEYPKLMQSPECDYILLMTDEISGTVVWSKFPPFPVGYYLHSWNLSNFKPFNEPITIQNL
jgi:hypothetical protein